MEIEKDFFIRVDRVDRVGDGAVSPDGRSLGMLSV